MKFIGYISQLCLFGLLVTAAVANEPGREITLNTILDNNYQATRGHGELHTIETADLILRISEADYTLTAHYRAAADGFMRIDVFAGDERVFSEGKDESGVWEWPGRQDAPRNVDHDGVGALEHGVEFNLYSLAELGKRGHSIELIDLERIREIDYYVLKVTLEDGFVSYRYVNSETWLVGISRDYRAFHPSIDPSKQNLETRYDQWHRSSGILHAGRSRTFNAETGEAVATAVIVQTKYNVAHTQLNMWRNFVPVGPPEVN